MAALNREFRAGRGFVYVRETAPGTVIVSFYPYSHADSVWPGTIQSADNVKGFPLDAALAGDAETVEAWVKRRDEWQ